jgi:hypothetical protein
MAPSYARGTARVSTVGQQLPDKYEFIVEIRDRLEQVQQHYNSF